MTKEDEMSSIDLDFMYETDAQSEATAFAARFDVQAEVIVEHGPAGGWPVVRFTGTTEAIIRLESAYDDQADSSSSTDIDVTNRHIDEM